MFSSSSSSSSEHELEELEAEEGNLWFVVMAVVVGSAVGVIVVNGVRRKGGGVTLVSAEGGKGDWGRAETKQKKFT
jgi:GTP-sensing pleiotropic transcriptional regulator CodY